MYSEWDAINLGAEVEESSVLARFPTSVGGPVCSSVVRHLASGLGLSAPPPEPSSLLTHSDVRWCMELIWYGLGQPLAEHDTIRDCVNVYCEWLAALLPNPKMCVPQTVCDDPNFYARTMMSHLQRLFLPRPDATPDATSRQTVLCHRVLRTLQSIARESQLLTPETWHSLLIFLLTVNDALLAPPTETDGLGEQLCDRVLGALFEVWLVACARYFPTPPLWRCLRDKCSQWRHRTSLIDQWRRSCVALTARLLAQTYGPEFPKLRITEEESQLLPSDTSPEYIAQSWFRVLHILSTPADLTRPLVISQTPRFLHHALSSSDVIEPAQHPCLNALPGSFLKMMKAVVCLTDAFLGCRDAGREKLCANFSPLRPKCNSIFHLLGSWIFECSLIGVSGDESASNYSLGRSEALTALCRILCSKRSGEEVLPVYLARSYLCIHHGLKSTSGPVACSILLNSHDLLKIDLDGVNVLLPVILFALEQVLPYADPRLRSLPNTASVAELRRSSIQILLCLLCLPSHFGQLAIRDITGRSQHTFQNLHPRIVNLVMQGLQSETDPVNTHLLLGCLSIVVNDLVHFESNSKVIQNEHLFGDSAVVDGAQGVFVKTIYLVCHRLISTWKHDVSVALAAVELLSSLARLPLKSCGLDWGECRRAVRWICDYVITQCMRPPPAHSKDLHSSIVAALYCIANWLVQWPRLADNAECLNTVLDVLGMAASGQRAKGKSIGDHAGKPVSQRVRVAAESVLSVLLEQVGHFPSVCGPVSLSTFLDEVALLKHAQLNADNPAEHFQYYLLDGCVLLGLLEQPLGNDQDAQPCVTILLRGPTGRHSWTMHLRQQPRHAAASAHHTVNPGRPLPMSADRDEEVTLKPRANTPVKLFEGFDKIPPCQAERSIPSMESIIAENQEEHDHLARLVDLQVSFEESVNFKNLAITTEYPDPNTECKPPSPCQEFQASRLFLSHMGLLDTVILKDSNSNQRTLLPLDASQPGFYADLRDLDGLPNRITETVLVCYVSAGQTSAAEIVQNQPNKVVPLYTEFINSLGWAVDPQHHLGFKGPSNRRQNLWYWADAMSELAFVVTETDSFVGPECRNVIVWLESFEDFPQFPLGALAHENAFVIYLHALSTGLFRVKMHCTNTRLCQALPLVDGAVVSRHVLGELVRQTLLHASGRRRLDSDTSQPPQVKRKAKIQEIGGNYKCVMDESALYASLFFRG